ncbi:hypothetical protein Pfo_019977 [Paulownia fortunei]|nr:hypothetical protein Pfo_019977 [Paulownia fortunei]
MVLIMSFELCNQTFTMLLHPSLLHFIFLLLALASSTTNLTTKPGCQAQCGSLSIPFPFRIGSNCSIGPSFDIICNTSTNPPKPYLSSTNTEVIEINPSRIRVKYPNLALTCYDLRDDQRGINITESSSISIDLSSTQYTLSDENWITAIGCDDMVAGLGRTGLNFGGGCVSFCSNRDDSGGNGFCPENGNGYSPGNGCCRTPIPRGNTQVNNFRTTALDAYLSDLHGKWRKSKLFPCSYAFVGENGIWNQSGFSFPLYNLDNSTAFLNDNPKLTSTPLVLDWRIGTENCSQAGRNSTTFACRDNSVCLDFDADVGGYLCRCLQGYQGNPYLSPGCQDIDECAATITNSCDSNSICTNTPGSFNCSCPHGYYGDGRRDGRGCNRLPPSKMINVSIGLGSGMGLLLLLSICFWLHKVFQKRENENRKEKFFRRNGGLLLQQQTNEGTLGKTKLFPAKELEKATDNFDESRILGQGGQGTVYKGMLSDGKIVAIKKSKLINHRNVVKLLGCCLETEVPLLVYEFMPNGTLFDLIHDPNTELPVPWNMRLKIAADTAGALAYLHYASSLPIYHRDIKSSNILLDEKYVVKVSNFGTSRSVAVDQTHLTTLVKGTFGYLDPEYFQSSQFTEKSDVYSFGVVLVELLTGQRPISLRRTEEERSLATQFLVSMEANSLEPILDAQVSEQGRKEEVIGVARLAQRCLNLKGKMRPTMKEVATELESFRISRMPSAVRDESQESRFHEAKPMMLSDFDHATQNAMLTMQFYASKYFSQNYFFLGPLTNATIPCTEKELCIPL